MKHVVILVAILAVLCVQPAEAATISLNPVADGYALSVYGANNWYGLNTGSTELEVYIGIIQPQVIEARSALEFDISAVPSGSTIQSAKLYLYALPIPDANIGVYGYIGNSTIEEADFNDNILPQTTTFDPELGENVIDVSGFLSSLFPGGTNFVGFQLRELLLDQPYNEFHSMEYNPNFSDFRPRLDIEYAPVPEPSTLLLLGSGLAVLVGFGRKKFKK